MNNILYIQVLNVYYKIKTVLFSKLNNFTLVEN